MTTRSDGDIIRTLRLRIRSNKNNLTREDQTRTSLIDPLLYSLGWDVGDPTQVRTEPRLSLGARPDYVMYDPKSKRPFMVIEAKKLGTRLSGSTGIDYQFQLQKYMRELHCSLGVVTNGDKWIFYRSDLSSGLTCVKTVSVSRNAITDFAVMVARDRHRAVNYRQKSEQMLREEKERRKAADRELTSEQETRHKTKRKLAKERKNREKAERWLANEKVRRKQASQSRTNQRIDTIIKITITAGGYLLAVVVTALLFVL